MTLYSLYILGSSWWFEIVMEELKARASKYKYFEARIDCNTPRYRRCICLFCVVGTLPTLICSKSGGSGNAVIPSKIKPILVACLA